MKYNHAQSKLICIQLFSKKSCSMLDGDVVNQCARCCIIQKPTRPILATACHHLNKNLLVEYTIRAKIVVG